MIRSVLKKTNTLFINIINESGALNFLYACKVFTLTMLSSTI